MTASQSDIIKTVSLSLGARSYDIKIGPGLLAEADRHLAPFISNRHVIIIADSHTKPLYQSALAQKITPICRKVDCLDVPAGESSKSLSCFGNLLEDILALEVDRKVVLIALGGGVIGDLVGYAAASLLRGVDFIQIPTSLLAQVDSSVGGKTGINARHGKNLIGAFYQPKIVLADSDVLASLPLRERKAGYAEIVKYGLLGDAAFFEWLEVNGDKVISGDKQAIQYAVMTSCLAKAAIVSADETEAGKRALLNLGHTFAHAFEAEAGYDGRLLHGEAVSVGLGLAFDFSAYLSRANGQEAVRVKQHLAKMGLPHSVADLPAGHTTPAKLVSHMMKDKKTQDGNLTFILVKEIGAAEIASHIDRQDVIHFLESQT
ncbi:MAG: 3-dehydroquinate synthase [Candidatus Puniceispirillaceae bacterium]